MSGTAEQHPPELAVPHRQELLVDEGSTEQHHLAQAHYTGLQSNSVEQQPPLQTDGLSLPHLNMPTPMTAAMTATPPMASDHSLKKPKGSMKGLWGVM